MTDRNECEFDLMKLIPELQVKVFEALPSPVAAMDLAMTCRALNTLFTAYKTNILAAVRDNMVAPFYEYYAFHERFHIPEPDHIKHPPPGGWPKITPEVCSESGKSDFVVDVLRHLPYISREVPSATKIDYMCTVVDYSLADPLEFKANDWRYGMGCQRFRGPDFFRHKVFITKGVLEGSVEMILDTRTGVMFEEGYLQTEGGAEADAEAEAQALPAREYFARKMRACRELRTLFVDGHYSHEGEGRPVHRPDGVWMEFKLTMPPYDAALMEGAREVLERNGEPHCPTRSFSLADLPDNNWVCQLYRKFGWPGKDWNKEEGLKAIMEYRDRRNAEAREWALEQNRKRLATLERLGPVVGVLHSF